MPETTRTFVAIAVPESLGEKLARLQSEMAPEVPGCRWVSASPFHVTLAFLGDVRQRDLNDVCQAVVDCARNFEPLEVDLRGVGAFPSAARARVIWAGLLAADPKPLLELRQQLVKALHRAGYRIDDERFHPHVTLGRMKTSRRGEADLSVLLARHAAWSGGSFRVDELITFASALSPDGPSYTPLVRAALSGEQKTTGPTEG